VESGRKMTKKDYILIADVLNSMYNDTDKHKDIIRETADRMSNALKVENELFDEFKFISACYKGGK